MPTQEEVRRRVAQFERRYPKTLSGRLKWWSKTLGIDHVRLFQLLGLSRAEAAEQPLSALPRIVRSHEDRAEVVDEMLAQLLASFDYDLPALSDAIHHPVVSVTGEKHRITRRPGEVIPLPYTPTPNSRSGILLNEIVAGGPSALPALLTYLSEAQIGNGRRGGRAD